MLLEVLITWDLYLEEKNDKVKALESYSEVEKILEENPDNQQLISAQLILARSFLDLGEIDRARDNALDAFDKTDKHDDKQLHALTSSLG